MRDAWPAERLVELATRLAGSEDESIALRALEWLSDRGHGRTPTVIEASVSGGPNVRDWSKVPLEERRAALAQIRGLLPAGDDKAA